MYFIFLKCFLFFELYIYYLFIIYWLFMYDLFKIFLVNI